MRFLAAFEASREPFLHHTIQDSSLMEISKKWRRFNSLWFGKCWLGISKDFTDFSEIQALQMTRNDARQY
jgi:hypothetical protein